MHTPLAALTALRRHRWLALGLTLCLVLALGGGLAVYLPGRAHAATTVVTTCTEAALDGAVAAANPGDTIQFGCSGTITLTSTLNITKDLTLEGSGQNVTLDGNHKVQVLSITGGANFSLDHLTIANGFTANAGGGVYASGGTLALSNCTFSNNTSQGQDGASASDSSGLGGGGGSGSGGGMYSIGGTVAISDCSFVGNVAQGGAGGAGGTNGSGDGGTGGGGGSGFGGALYGYRSTIAVVNSVFANNIAQGGVGGNGGSGCAKCSGAAGGPGGEGGFGNGGGIYISRGQLTLTNSTVENNSALGASGGSGASGVNGGNGGDGGPGGFGTGGGFSSATGSDTDGFIFSLTGSTVSGNIVRGGSGGAGGLGTVGGNGGNGGNAIAGGAFSFVYTSGTFSNCTISGNGTQAGDGGRGSSSSSSGNGGDGLGGGLYAANGNSAVITLSNCTLASNSAQRGNGGPGGNAGSAGGQNAYYGTSGSLPGTFHLSNTLLGGSAGDNCAGFSASIIDIGYNLDSGTSCGFSAANHSLSNTDPKLAALGNYGGPTQTMALLPGSPAINAGGSSANGCPATDQRGVSRPQGSACDIGAYEFVPTTTTTLSANPNPALYQQAVQLCATVHPAPGTPGPATGTVRFLDGSTTLGSGQLGSSGSACFSTAGLSVGDHRLTASYSGDASFSASVSSPLTVTIQIEGEDVAGSASGSSASNASSSGSDTSQTQANAGQNDAGAAGTGQVQRQRAAPRRPSGGAWSGWLGTGLGALLALLGLAGLGAVFVRAWRRRSVPEMPGS